MQINKNILKKVAAGIVIGQLVLFLSLSPTLAKADNLVIQDDGEIVLILTSDNSILGVTSPSTPAPAAPAPAASSAPAPVPVPAPVKAQSFIPAYVESSVQVKPSDNNAKKLQVTISTPVTSPKPSTPPSDTKQTAAPPPPPVVPSKTVTKNVDQVVAQGANGQVVFSVKSNQANQVTIQQGSTQATTALPIQINNTTHTISVVTPTGSPTKVSVLPSEAVQGAAQKGIITASPNTKTTISQKNGQVIYSVQGQKSGKLFGLFNVSAPASADISVKSGKTVNTTQSPLLNTFGFLIK